MTDYSNMTRGEAVERCITLEALLETACADLIDAGRMIERYEHPSMRPLTEQNFRTYSSARRIEAKYRKQFGPSQTQQEQKP